MQDAQLQQVGGAGGQPVAAGVDAVRPQVPGFAAYAQRLQQARAQVVVQRLAGGAGQDGRQHVAGRAGVDVGAARLVHHRQLEELGDPAAVEPAPDGARGFRGLAGAHGQQVFHRHRRQLVVHHRWQLARKERHHLVAELEMPFGDRQANGAGGKALGRRVQDARPLGAIRPAPALGHHVAVAVQHDAVHFQLVGIQLIQQRQHAPAVHPHAGRQRARQAVSRGGRDGRRGADRLREIGHEDRCCVLISAAAPGQTPAPCRFPAAGRIVRMHFK